MKHNLNPVMNAQLDRNRRFKGHRRNLSDPRFSTSLTDAYGEDQVCIFWKNFCLVGYIFWIFMCSPCKYNVFLTD